VNYTVTHPTAGYAGTITVKGFTMQFASRVYSGPVPDNVVAELTRIGYTVAAQPAADVAVAPLAGLSITSGTAAPTTGTWARGDIRFNSAPSAAGTAGWVCVTAGSPGTWKAMGNLAA
jgi:hypothetical protein